LCPTSDLDFVALANLFRRLAPHEYKHVCKKEIAFIEAVGASRVSRDIVPLHPHRV